MSLQVEVIMDDDSQQLANNQSTRESSDHALSVEIPNHMKCDQMDKDDEELVAMDRYFRPITKIRSLPIRSLPDPSPSVNHQASGQAVGNFRPITKIPSAKEVLLKSLSEEEFRERVVIRQICPAFETDSSPSKQQANDIELISNENQLKDQLIPLSQSTPVGEQPVETVTSDPSPSVNHQASGQAVGNPDKEMDLSLGAEAIAESSEPLGEISRDSNEIAKQILLRRIEKSTSQVTEQATFSECVDDSTHISSGFSDSNVGSIPKPNIPSSSDSSIRIFPRYWIRHDRPVINPPQWHIGDTTKAEQKYDEKNRVFMRWLVGFREATEIHDGYLMYRYLEENIVEIQYGGLKRSLNFLRAALIVAIGESLTHEKLLAPHFFLEGDCLSGKEVLHEMLFGSETANYLLSSLENLNAFKYYDATKCVSVFPNCGTLFFENTALQETILTIHRTAVQCEYGIINPSCCFMLCDKQNGSELMSVKHPISFRAKTVIVKFGRGIYAPSLVSFNKHARRDVLFDLIKRTKTSNIKEVNGCVEKDPLAQVLYLRASSFITRKEKADNDSL